MNSEQVELLFNGLLDLWELSVLKEGELTLLLDDLDPLWRNRLQDYVRSLGAVERASSLVSPMRQVTKAVLEGRASPERMQELLREVLKKPN